MDSIIEVKRNRADKTPMKIEFDFGNDLADAQSKFDGGTALDSVVFPLFVSAAKAQLTAYVQKLMESENEETKKPYTTAQVQKLVKDWKPGANRRAKANVDRAADVFSGLNDQEKQALISKLGLAPAAKDAPAS